MYGTVKKRMRRKKRLFDELCEDECLTDAEKNFKTSIYYTCIDIVTTQPSRWFEDFAIVTVLDFAAYTHVHY